jgi:integrase
MPEKLTQARIDRLEPGTPGTLHDTALPGLLIRITKTRVTYAVQRPPSPAKPSPAKPPPGKLSPGKKPAKKAGKKAARAPSRTAAISIAPAIGEDRISLADARVRAKQVLADGAGSKARTQSSRVEIPLDAIAAWGAKVGALESPVLRGLFLFGLYSGLRPAQLLGLRREWVDLKRKRIELPVAVLPEGEPFVLPLSDELSILTRRALGWVRRW